MKSLLVAAALAFWAVPAQAQLPAVPADAAAKAKAEGAKAEGVAQEKAAADAGQPWPATRR